jgi:hypothetical protein
MRKLERCLVAALVAIVWCVCVWLTIAPFSAEAAEWRDMNRQIDATNFLVNRGCSGTLVDADKGLVLSAYHCINQQYETVEREKVDDSGVVTKEKAIVYLTNTTPSAIRILKGLVRHEHPFRASFPQRRSGLRSA